MTTDYVDEMIASARLEIGRDRCFWTVILYCEMLVEDRGPKAVFHTLSRSMAEFYMERYRCTLAGRPLPEWGERRVEYAQDRVATHTKELDLYAQTWREWDRYFDDEERAEIRADEAVVRLVLDSSLEELGAHIAADSETDVE